MSAHVLWYLGIGYPSPCKRHVHPEVARMGFVRNRDQYASVRGGFLSLFPAAYGVHNPADAPALTSQGSDFLSPFPQPGGSRAHGRRSSVGRAAVCKTVCRGFESRPDLHGAYAAPDARSGNLLIYPKLTAGKDRPPGLIHARRLYGTVIRFKQACA